MLRMDSIPKYEIGLSEIYLDSKNDVMLLHIVDIDIMKCHLLQMTGDFMLDCIHSL